MKKKFSFKGVQVQYLLEGKGEPLLMLHGWGGSKESFDDLKTILLKNFQLIIPDFPGFGESDDPKKAWEVSDYSECIQSLLDELEIKTPYVLGHSFGGRVIIKLASSQKDFFKKIVLCASAGIKPKKNLKKRVLYFIAKTGKFLFKVPGFKYFAEFARKVLYKIAKSGDYNKVSGVMRKTFLKVITENFEPLLKKIEKDTLVVWGDSDTVTPLVDGKRMHMLISGSKFVEIPGARHGLHHTHAEIVAREVLHFLR